tara:strand:- start:167 stop:706 length:540 start_codon:yes stop_codon:yes gene_type:complete
MNNCRKSPLTEIIVDPICNKIFNNFNLDLILQFCIMFFTLSVYYLLNNSYEKSSIFYLIAFIFFNCLSKNTQNKDINKMYFLVNIFFQLYIFFSNKLQPSIVLLSLIISILSILSFSIINYSNNFDHNLKKITDKLALLIYPNNDKTKNYHINNFWNIFDFSFFSLFIFILINKKNENY